MDTGVGRPWPFLSMPAAVNATGVCVIVDGPPCTISDLLLCLLPCSVRLAAHSLACTCSLLLSPYFPSPPTQVVSSNPGVPALQIATGPRHACVLTFDTSLVDLQHLALKSDTPASNAAFLESVTPVCWGAGGMHSSDNLTPPAIGDAAAGDPIVSVRTGDGFTCVRTFKGRVQCSGEYGNLEGPAEDRVPQGVLFSALTVGEKHVVGIEAGSSELRAWGACSSLNECTPPTGISFAGAEGSLSAGRMFACALDTRLRPHCWGRVFWPRATPETSEFIEINSGMTHTCGIRRNDTRAACWGECSFGEYVGGGSWEGVLSVARGLCARWAAAPRLRYAAAPAAAAPPRCLLHRLADPIGLERQLGPDIGIPLRTHRRARPNPVRRHREKGVFLDLGAVDPLVVRPEHATTHITFAERPGPVALVVGAHLRRLVDGQRRTVRQEDRVHDLAAHPPRAERLVAALELQAPRALRRIVGRTVTGYKRRGTQKRNMRGRQCGTSHGAQSGWQED